MTKIRYKWRGDRLVEKDILDGFQLDITSREELMELAKGEGLTHPINWDVWEKTVQQAKEIIEQVVGDETILSRQLKEVYAYDLNTGEEIGHYTSAQEASEALNVIKGTIQHYAWKERPYLTKELFFSYEPITRQEVVKHKPKKQTNYRGGIPTEKYVYDLNYKLLGHYKSTAEVAEVYNLPSKQVNYIAWKQRPYWKRKLIILSKPMDEKTKREIEFTRLRKGRTQTDERN